MRVIPNKYSALRLSGLARDKTEQVSVDSRPQRGKTRPGYIAVCAHAHVTKQPCSFYLVHTKALDQHA